MYFAYCYLSLARRITSSREGVCLTANRRAAWCQKLKHIKRKAKRQEKHRKRLAQGFFQLAAKAKIPRTNRT